MAKLNDAEELKVALAALPSWRLEGGKLVRDFSFSDFAAAMIFVNQVAALAEAANHHPDIDISYNQVRLALISHDDGGITSRDLSFAGNIDAQLPG